MKQSDSIGKLVASLVVAQSKIGAGVTKDASNDVFSSGYATLGAVISATKDALLAEGIVVLQSPGEYIDFKVCVTTRLCHSSGEWLEGTCSSPLEFVDPQGFGSAVAYLRRYAMTSMLWLYQAGSDDDANGVSNRVPGQAAAGTPSVSDEVMKKRAEQWKNNIANASLERLKLAKDTAKSIFTGESLAEITKLIDMHITAANEKEPFSL